MWSIWKNDHLNLSWSLLATVTIFAVSSDHTPMKKKFSRSVWIWLTLSVIYDKIIEKFSKDYNICSFSTVRNGRYLESTSTTCDKLAHTVGKD